MKDTGGPAFPYSGVYKGSDTNYIIDNHGMTLRDYFAAKAMQAFITGAMSDGTPLNTMHGDDKEVAKVAYIIADAMLKDRE